MTGQKVHRPHDLCTLLIGVGNVGGGACSGKVLLKALWGYQKRERKWNGHSR